MRILIVSNMDSERPYGNWARSYYIGEAISNSEDVVQLGYDTSGVKYCRSLSTHSKSITEYFRTIRKVNKQFKPHVVYAHETFPAMAAYLVIHNASTKAKLIFDIHALHAAEYKAMLKYYDNIAQGLYFFSKAYYPQRFIVGRGIPLIAASVELKSMLMKWYKVDGDIVNVVPNGAPLDLLKSPMSAQNPYNSNFPNALLIAPKNNLPNEFAVKLIMETAKILRKLPGGKDIRIIVVGGGWRKEEIEIYPNLTYSGFVENIISFIDHADVCLLPYPQKAICGGARTKALDYFVRAKCVLSTEEGLRGLGEFKNNVHVVLSSDNPEIYAQNLLDIVHNSDGCKRIGENARRLVELEYNWQRSSEKVLSMFEWLLNQDSDEQ